MIKLYNATTYYNNYGNDNSINDSFISIFIIIFSIIIITIIYRLVKSTLSWFEDEKSPKITVHAKIVAKRTDVRHYHHENGWDSSSKYYTTFELKNNQRIELHLQGNIYGTLAEGDLGELTYQGKRFIEFIRDI